jgi:hypothetical protein
MRCTASHQNEITHTTCPSCIHKWNKASSIVKSAHQPYCAIGVHPQRILLVLVHRCKQRAILRDGPRCCHSTKNSLVALGLPFWPLLPIPLFRPSCIPIIPSRVSGSHGGWRRAPAALPKVYLGHPPKPCTPLASLLWPVQVETPVTSVTQHRPYSYLTSQVPLCKCKIRPRLASLWFVYYPANVGHAVVLYPRF